MTKAAFITTATVGAIEGVQHIPSPNGTIEIVKLAIQAIVAIVGLFKMFKKPKTQSNNENQE
jgi:hypothetical protein